MRLIFLLSLSRLARRAAPAFCSHAAQPRRISYLPAPHPASLPLDELKKACETRATKGSGPGGQHRNKVQTAIVLKHVPSELTGAASESRSQAANLKKATFRLRMRLAIDRRTEQLDATPSALWSSRARGGKLAINEQHDDFPALIAEALDWIHHRGDIKPAAEGLGVSTSQLVKLLRKEPQALGLVNDERQARDLPRLN